MTDQSTLDQPRHADAASAIDVPAIFAELMANDAQFRATMPDPAISAAKTAPGLNLAQMIATCMEGYADRPALARRAEERVIDAATGRTVRRMLGRFEAVTYRELWRRARALAALWHGDDARPLRAGDLVCIIGFGGIDFAVADLAAMHNGAVVVPMQTAGAPQQVQAVFDEVAPNWLVTGVEQLDMAVTLVLGGHRPLGLLVYGYDPAVDDERTCMENARAALAGAGMDRLLVTLEEAIAAGEALPAAPLFSESDCDERLCCIYYTSGSTGLPKGAMYPERMLKPIWGVEGQLPLLTVLYMPLNHTAGRAGLHAALGNGGTGHFTAKSDLSEIFEDIRLVRPTMMTVVPRICEMLQQRFEAAFDAHKDKPASEQARLRRELLAELRRDALGGRVLTALFSAAPLSPELRQFMEDCLGYPMIDSYGATEITGVIRNRRILSPPVTAYRLDDVPELGYFRTDKPHPRGELRVKTDHLMLGYYKRPDVTAQAFDEEGYYKTGDIMAEVAPGEFVYVDRRNNVIKLAQGEFVAIARLETIYAAGHPAIHQVYLYGTGARSFLLGVIVPDAQYLARRGVAGDDAAIKALLRDAINEIARAEKLNPYEVPRDFIVEHEPFTVANRLLTGVGKPQRPAQRERYGEALEAMYDAMAAGQREELNRLRQDGRTRPVAETVRHAVRATLALDELAPDFAGTFAQLGGDSLSALSCSLLLEEIYGFEVPVATINHPSGGLAHIAATIARQLAGEGQCGSFAAVHGRGATTIRAADLTLDRFIDPAELDAATVALPPAPDVRTVLLTGANGFLGRFLCLEWLERMAAVGGRVICIGRGHDAADARRRIAAAYASGDPALEVRFAELAGQALEVLPGDLSEPRFGLDETAWRDLAERVDAIVHPAALVNHVLSYQQLFGPNVAGTAELIRLALAHRLKPFTFVSTMAAAYGPAGLIAEDADVRQATPARDVAGDGYAAGYANSKWAAEVLLREANAHFGLPVHVFRSDMILPHTRWRGQINASDMFTRWLLSVVATGLAPASFYAGAGAGHYEGLPVDFVARAIGDLAARAGSDWRTFHVLNPHDDGVSLDSFVDWAMAQGHAIDRIASHDDWFARFETALLALPEAQRQASSLPLLHQLRAPSPGGRAGAVPAAGFTAAIAAGEVRDYPAIPSLDAEYIAKCLADIRHLGMLD